MDVVAVDWSGRRIGEQRHLWVAVVRGGALVELRNGRSREEVVGDLVAMCSGGDVVVGLDFAFSMPAWFLRSWGLCSAHELWALASADGEEWLARCEPPFWGRPGRPRPDLGTRAHLRRSEMALATVGGIRAKSAFQIGGAGAVGTGSVRGLPALLRLHEAGFSIWPFDPPGASTVIEIYPRLLTGAVVKRSAEARAAYLSEAGLDVRSLLWGAAGRSEDAFDAAVSAIVMARHLAELAALQPTRDPVVRLEGAIWEPGRPSGGPVRESARL